MAQFINFEAETEVVEVEDAKEGDEISNVSEDSFIDDQEVGADVNFYGQFANVKNDLDQVLTEAHNKVLEGKKINFMKLNYKHLKQKD